MEKSKLLSILSHASIFISTIGISVGIPLVIFFISEDSVTKGNAREALNFHFNVWLYGIIFGILAFFTFGILGWILFPLLGLFTIIMPILAIVQLWGQPDEVFKYPFIWRLL
jgi:hypothetical protein